ncbi:Tfp pilus assembly protein PilF [Roseiarcus fermentans]|uniref:Tfp pilus assembly protein PilF n=1 Tax=Roseiarcus fermentans TaxID=1473586 RepID=A0A366F4A1_9HYPH|nr:tetratricopeptide repeat protein [Roseiarcus fermentans]RBP08535.1 Tfp pilus assembly protein PilF [Roseiarcus fermentans]
MIERVLLGPDPSKHFNCRLQLREALAAVQRMRGEQVDVPPTEDAPEATPAKPTCVSNIPITVPRHFLGREPAIAAIDAALRASGGRAAITALFGLRGVGKTVLAAAYVARRRAEYRATWWVRAQTPETMRADIVALGVRLGWVSADAKEEEALARVLDKLRDEGEGLLIVYDNAVDAKSLAPFLPRAGAARVIVTSNAHDWRRIAAPVEIKVWPKEVGADYLVARTGRGAERADAEALSETLGGLPLAHEQAAAYCERLEIPFAEYRRRFVSAPARFLDDAKHAPAEYHDGLTVAKTFALAIDEAAKLHPAAEPLIVFAALLAPEPIPLFLFAEGREKLGEPLASLLADDGLDEAVAALRAFALVDRETIPDERDPSIATDAIRLHQLVRLAAARRGQGDASATRRALIEAMAGVYPVGVDSDAAAWPRTRRLDAIMVDLAQADETPDGAEAATASVLDWLASYRQGALSAYSEARPLFERALTIREKALGPDHPATAASLNNLALLLQAQGDLAGARLLFERALTIWETALGLGHPDTAVGLNNLAELLRHQGDLAGARRLLERALAILEKALGHDHPTTGRSLNNLAVLLRDQGDLAGARPLFERGLAILEKAFGPDHPITGRSLNNLGILLRDQGDLAGARPLLERALAILEKALGPDHPDTAASLNSLAELLQSQGDRAGARPLFERALAIRETALRPGHPSTALTRANLARLRLADGAPAEALALAEAALAAHDKALRADHTWTKDSARAVAAALDALGRGEEAAAVRARYGLDGGATGQGEAPG